MVDYCGECCYICGGEQDFDGEFYECGECGYKFEEGGGDLRIRTPYFQDIRVCEEDVTKFLIFCMRARQVEGYEFGDHQ